MVDFKKRINSSGSEKITDPIEIYKRLDRKSVTGPLRPVQNEILSTWYSNRLNDKDLVVKLHTGEGKTLIGLLILNSKLNANAKPCLYVCPNRYLAQQVTEEARKFGIPICSIQKDNQLPNEFLSGRKILITHAQKLFNGKSIFGIDNNSTDIDCLVLDDSHACIDAIKGSFTIKIKRTHDSYNQIISLFEDDLRNQGEGSFLDMQSGDYDTVLPVPYWSWIERKTELTQILSEHRNDDEITFVWPIIKDHIDKCQAFISSTEIEISPYLIPLNKFGSFAKANQRILMSATTQDDSFFIKGLNFSIESIRSPLTVADIKWSGEKMILLPSLIHDDLERELIINKFAKPANKSYGIVSLVSSWKKAQVYSTLGANVATTENIFDLINQLKRGNCEKTLAIINRYDGIDLPDESCRILIIDSMPYFNSLYERYEELCRSSSDVTNIRLAQKIEQGLGRSVRGEKDYTVIILIGADLVRFVKSIRTNVYFSNQTRKQIEIGFQVVDMAKDDLTSMEPFQAFTNLIRQSLKRDDGWKEFYSEEMNKIESDESRIDIYNLLKTERDCELANLLGDYETAATKMQQLIDNANLNENDRGWYLQILARYKYNISKLESNLIQKGAFKNNLQLLKPKEGINYKKIEYISGGRISKIKDFISQFSSYEEFALAIEDVLSNLNFGVDSEKFEAALYELGNLLGFVCQRPDKEIRKGPDVLWSAPDNQYFMFECKNEVSEERSEITKYEAGQMNSHCGWFESEYGEATVKRILIIPTKELSYYGDFTHEVEIMRKGKLRELKLNVKSFMKEFKNYKLSDLADERIEQFIETNKLEIKALDDAYTEKYAKRLKP